MSVRDGCRQCPDDLAEICLRVKEKSRNYDQYNFSARYNDFLKAFFDLGQEYDRVDDFYRICIAVPLAMSDLPCALYLVDEKTGELRLACDTVRGRVYDSVSAEPPIRISLEAYESGGSYIVPIYSRSMEDSANGLNIAMVVMSAVGRKGGCIPWNDLLVAPFLLQADYLQQLFILSGGEL